MVLKKSFRIAICDDEQQDVLHIYEMVCRILQAENIDGEIFCYNSGEELFKAIQNGRRYDLFLLDVMMPQQDGMELAEYLHKGGHEGDIVFISINREMALRGYEVEAKRYLLKPVDAGYLREALLYCYHNMQKKELIISADGGICRVNYQEIKYIETHGRGSRILLEKGEVFTSQRISELEPLCDDRCFARCHQGYIVNFEFIEKLKYSEIVLKDGECIPVSKHRIKQIRQKFLSFLSA